MIIINWDDSLTEDGILAGILDRDNLDRPRWLIIKISGPYHLRKLTLNIAIELCAGFHKPVKFVFSQTCTVDEEVVSLFMF